MDRAAHVTILLRISEGGETDFMKAVKQIDEGWPVPVATPEVAAKVLRHYGCSETYITNRINFALFGTQTEDGLIG